MGAWAARETLQHPEPLRLGDFGAYARGGRGVGSDLDLIAIVTESPRHWMHRSLDWSLDGLPGPAELVAYTEGERDQVRIEGRRFARTVAAEAVWPFPGGGESARPVAS